MRRSSPDANLVCLRDVRTLMLFTAGAALTSIVPERWDAGIARRLPSWVEKFRAVQIQKLGRTMAGVLPEECHSVDSYRIARDHYVMRMEDVWGRTRGIGFRGWHPQVTIEGLERLKAALARGRGAILWSMRFSSATALKQAFCWDGFPLVHLSRAAHGASSSTKTGIGLVGPLYCRAENPYLAERIRIPLDGSLGYISALKQHLRDNRCINIFGEHRGRQNVSATVLGVRRQFALGAPSLAWSEGAALLTCYPLRSAPFSYRVIVDDEIEVDRSISRKQFAREAVAKFARRLEARIRSAPADWQGWSYWPAGEIE